MTNTLLKKRTGWFHRSLLICSFFLYGITSAHAVNPQAKGDYDTMNIHIRGVVQVQQDCEFAADNNEFDVDFGDVFIDQISNKSYKARINYKFNCPAGASTDDVTLRVNGMRASWDPTAFSTETDGVALHLTDEDKLVQPGESMKVAVDGSTDVEIELLKQDGAKLIAGTQFYAVLLLTIVKD